MIKSRGRTCFTSLYVPRIACMKLNLWRVRSRIVSTLHVEKQRSEIRAGLYDFSILRTRLVSSCQSHAKSWTFQRTQYNRVSHHGDSFASQTASRTRPWFSRIDWTQSRDRKSDRLILVVRTDTRDISRDRINGNNSTSANDAPTINEIYRGQVWPATALLSRSRWII